MPKLPRPSGAEMVRFLKSQGFRVARIRGSHHILVKDQLRTIIPVHGAETLRAQLMRSAEDGQRQVAVVALGLTEHRG